MNADIFLSVLKGSGMGLAIGVALIALIIVIFGSSIAESRRTDKEKRLVKSVVMEMTPAHM